MKGRRYPLEALRTVRQRNVDSQGQALALELERTRRVGAAAQAAAQAEQREAERVARELAAEQCRLEAGLGRVSDLARQSEWQRAEQARLAALAEATRQASDALSAQRVAEARQRQRLAGADAERELVDEHRAGWEREQHAERELAQDDEAEERAAALRGGRRLR